MTLLQSTSSSVPVKSVAGRVAGIALAVCISAMVLVQLVSLNVRNPLTATLSSYAWATDGWLFGLSLLSLAVATAVLGLQVRRTMVTTGTGIPAALLAASGAATGAALFPADPDGVTLTGEAHRYFSIVLMVAIPLAALLMVRGRGGWSVTGMRRRRAIRLIGTSVAAGVVFLTAQSLAAPLGEGVSQRVLVAAVFALAVLIFGEIRRELQRPA